VLCTMRIRTICASGMCMGYCLDESVRMSPELSMFVSIEIRFGFLATSRRRV
jgi:hypothetical protein